MALSGPVAGIGKIFVLVVALMLRCWLDGETLVLPLSPGFSSFPTESQSPASGTSPRLHVERAYATLPGVRAASSGVYIVLFDR